MPQIKSPKIRILIADDEIILSQRLAEFLNKNGFEARYVASGEGVRRTLERWEPQILLYDLMLPELNALEFLKTFITERSRLKVMVTSGHNNPANIRECMRLGAADYLSKPIGQEAVLSRIVLQMQQKQEITEFRPTTSADYESAQFFMHLTELVLRETLRGRSPLETLFTLTGLMSVSLRAVRVSVVKCDPGSGKGCVIASSDKKDICELLIELHKYPEIVYVMNTEKALAVNSLSADPTLHFVTRIAKSINFNAMLVAPVRVGGRNWGVLSIRMADTKTQLTEYEIRWSQIVAHIIALVVSRSTELSVLSEPSAA